MQKEQTLQKQGMKNDTSNIQPISLIEFEHLKHSFKKACKNHKLPTSLWIKACLSNHFTNEKLISQETKTQV